MPFQVSLIRHTPSNMSEQFEHQPLSRMLLQVWRPISASVVLRPPWKLFEIGKETQLLVSCSPVK